MSELISYRILLDGNELYNAYTSVNIGISSANLNLEINQPGSFTFTTGFYAGMYELFKPYKSIVAVEMSYIVDDDIVDQYTPFLGRIIDKSRDIYGNITVTCEGSFNCLNDVYIPYREGYYTTIGNTLAEIQFDYNINPKNHPPIRINFDGTHSEGIDKALEFISSDSNAENIDSESDETTNKPLEFRRPLDLLENKVLNRMNAIFYPVHSPSNSLTSYAFIDHIGVGLSYTSEHPARESLIIQDSAYGTYPSFGIGDNILSISEDLIKEGDKYSGVLPVGKDGLTISGEDRLTDGDVVWSEALESKYGPIVKLAEFSEITDPKDLVNLAALYLNLYGEDYGYKYTVTAIEPCEVIESINHLSRIGHVACVKTIDSVVYVQPFLSIRYNLMDLQSNEYTIGPLIPNSIIDEEITHLK